MAGRPSRYLGAFLLFGVVCTIGTIGAVGAVGAGEAAPTLLVRSVDSSDPNDTVATVVYTGPAGDVADITVSENGREADIESLQSFGPQTPQSIALIFEISEAMDDPGALVAAKQGARNWVESLPDGVGQRFAVITASDTADLIQDYTTSRERVLNAIERVGPVDYEKGRKQTALWSAARLAASGLAEEPGTGSLVVMSGQGDTTGTDVAAARGAVASADAITVLLEFTGAKGGSSGLGSLVETHGGLVLKTDSAAGMEGLVGDAQTTLTDGQFRVQFASAVPVGEVADLTVTIGDRSQSVSYVVGTYSGGQQALTLEVKATAGGVSFLQTPLGLVLTVLAALLAVGGLAYGIVSIMVRDDQLANVLQPYTEAPGELDHGDGDSDSYAKTALVQRAVVLTEQLAEDRGMLTRIEGALERANLPLRAGEALFFYGAGVAILTILALALSGSVILGVVAGVIVALIPLSVVSFLAGQRKKKFMGQLPDTLQLLSGTLRAGYSLMQGVESVSQEVEDPMGLELRRVVTEARLGRPLEEALEGTAERMDSPDFAWAVMAIRIQREVGGNLSELLMTVSETMVARERLRRDVRTLTAEGRMSAIILGGLPPGLGFMMYVLNPEYMETLFTDGLGHVLLALATVSMLIGFAWMRKIINIEI